MGAFHFRGSRGGKHKKRRIATRTCIRKSTVSYQGNTINKSNLIKVRVVNDQNQNEVRFATWNARSIKAKNKSAALCDFVISNQLDILAITESWLTGDGRDDVAIADIQNTLPNYKLHHSHRRHRRGGGTAILVRDGLHVRINETCEFNSMEYMNVTISSSSTSFQLILIYKLKSDKKNKFTSSMFLDEFSSLLATLTVGGGHLLLTGDFNVHVDVADDREAQSFLNILDLHDLKQLVVGPTHIGNHTLDLLITWKQDNFVSHISTHSHLPSDHYAVKCFIKINRPEPSIKAMQTRKIRNIKRDIFRSDIRSALLRLPSDADCDSLVNEYNNILSKTLDEHAPLVNRSVVLRPHAPWYSDALRAEKKERRRLERRASQTGLTVFKEAYKDQCSKYNSLLSKAKTEYHNNQITTCDQRDLFRVVSNLTSPRVEQPLPTHECPKDLADSFAEFFYKKIKKLRNSLHDTTTASMSVELTESCQSTFSSFSAVSEEEVLKSIKSASIKSCTLDPLPAGLLKLCLDDLLPVITRIANFSLSSGVFPQALKHASVIPLLKKSGLDTNILSNYRPISNLPFLGKVIERVAVNQLQTYLIDNDLHVPMQSAYRKYHSTETALLRVQNDILTALDKQKEAVLVLLDFSAAFDTIDHKQLLTRLTERYGITGKALSWFSSYLDGRTQSISVRGASSDPVAVDCGVPQGSVTGPIDFILFSAPLQDIITAHGIQSVVYADDTQLYLTFHPRDREAAIKKIETCIVDIRS